MRKFYPPDGHSVLYGINAKQIAAWVHVTERTVRRWKRGEDPPYAATQLVELLSTGNMGIVDKDWTGWALKDGLLVAPNGDRFSPGEVMSMTYWRALARSYQIEQRLPRQADWVADAWVPAPATSDFV